MTSLVYTHNPPEFSPQTLQVDTSKHLPLGGHGQRLFSLPIVQNFISSLPTTTSNLDECVFDYE